MELTDDQLGGDQWRRNEEEVGDRVEVEGLEWTQVLRVMQTGKSTGNVRGLGVGGSVGSMHESGSGVGVEAVMAGQLAVAGHLRAN